MIFLALRGILFLSVIGCYSVALLRLINEFFVSRYTNYLNEEITKTSARFQSHTTNSPTFIDENVIQKFNLENNNNNNKFQNNYMDGNKEKTQLKKADEGGELIVSGTVANEIYNHKNCLQELKNVFVVDVAMDGAGNSCKCKEKYQIGKNEKSNNQHQCTLLSSFSSRTAMLSGSGTIKVENGVDNEKRKSEKLIESENGDGSSGGSGNGGDNDNDSSQARWRNPAGSENEISKVCLASPLYCCDYNCNESGRGAGGGGGGNHGGEKKNDDGSCMTKPGNQRNHVVDDDERVGGSGDYTDSNDELWLEYWKYKAIQMDNERQIVAGDDDNDIAGK